MAGRAAERASAGILVLGVALGALLLIAVLGVVGSAFVAHAELQQAADVAAAVLEAPHGDAPQQRATELARGNGARSVTIGDADASGRLEVVVSATRSERMYGLGAATISARAFATLPVATTGDGGPNPPGVYGGPLEYVKGVPVCPAVAAAFRRMDAAASAAGVGLAPTSGFRGYAAQAALFATLGPRLAAPPGTSRHHDATELDIAVGAAGSPVHRWLQANGPAFGFIQRYSWEPWHWGYVAGC